MAVVISLIHGKKDEAFRNSEIGSLKKIKDSEHQNVKTFES